MEIVVKRGSIVSADAEAIVNPANSRGVMGGGVAKAIKGACGDEVQRQAMQKAPIAVGDAVLTGGGKSRFKAIVHAPTMGKPSQKIGPGNVERALWAALKAADEAGLKSLAIPGLGTGTGRVAKDVAAAAMVGVIRSFVPKSLAKLILMDKDEAMVRQWERFLREGEDL